MDGLVQSIVYDTSSPANIYSATVMRKVDGDQKIVMIASKKDLITLESKIVDDKVETYIVELNFSNISCEYHNCSRYGQLFPLSHCLNVCMFKGNAEIISIHCINKCKEFDDFVIGITFALVCTSYNTNIDYTTCTSKCSGIFLNALIIYNIVNL